MWLRALIVCDDVRLELGGTVSLIGVYADRIVVPPGDGEIVLPRLAIYAVVAGLAGADKLAWRQWFSAAGAEPVAPVSEGHDPHDPGADEHRIVNFLAPLALPGPGGYRLTFEIETWRARETIEHHLVVERLPALADAA